MLGIIKLEYCLTQKHHNISSRNTTGKSNIYVTHWLCYLRCIIIFFWSSDWLLDFILLCSKLLTYYHHCELPSHTWYGWSREVLLMSLARMITTERYQFLYLSRDNLDYTNQPNTSLTQSPFQKTSSNYITGIAK